MINKDIIIIKQAELYAPQKQGFKDILIGGGKILAIEDSIPMESFSKFDILTIDAKGLKAIPGLIDGHVHIAGAGGEGGPSTRTPELSIKDMIIAGVTTVIGLLGTDGMTRNPESVLMKVKSLRAEGVSAWMLTGSYQVPTPTILGDVGKDISLIEEIIGVGEVAISDFRSSEPTVNELIRMASHARIGGMFSGKSGIVVLHLGDRKNPFEKIYQAVNESDLNFNQFLPTHCNRNKYLIEETKKYGRNGYVDLTAYPINSGNDENKASKCIIELLNSGVPVENITVTSDGCGSLPVFENGKLAKLGIGNPNSIFNTLVELIKDEGIMLEQALPFVSSNPAQILQLRGKGFIRTGMDADLNLIDNNMDIKYLIANGNIMIKNGQRIKKGSFEE